MPRVITEATYNLMKSCAGAAVLSMFALALDWRPQHGDWYQQYSIWSAERGGR